MLLFQKCFLFYFCIASSSLMVLASQENEYASKEKIYGFKSANIYLSHMGDILGLNTYQGFLLFDLSSKGVLLEDSRKVMLERSRLMTQKLEKVAVDDTKEEWLFEESENTISLDKMPYWEQLSLYRLSSPIQPLTLCSKIVFISEPTPVLPDDDGLSCHLSFQLNEYGTPCSWRGLQSSKSIKMKDPYLMLTHPTHRKGYVGVYDVRSKVPKNLLANFLKSHSVVSLGKGSKVGECILLIRISDLAYDVVYWDVKKQKKCAKDVRLTVPNQYFMLVTAGEAPGFALVWKNRFRYYSYLRLHFFIHYMFRECHLSALKWSKALDQLVCDYIGIPYATLYMVCDREYSQHYPVYYIILKKKETKVPSINDNKLSDNNTSNTEIIDSNIKDSNPNNEEDAWIVDMVESKDPNSSIQSINNSNNDVDNNPHISFGIAIFIAFMAAMYVIYKYWYLPRKNSL